MTWIRAYLGAIAALVAIDAVWLGYVAGSLYQTRLDHLLAAEAQPAGAALFYALYAGGVVVLAVRPALLSATWRAAAWHGAVLGAVAYGTYELTNWSTLRGWPPILVPVDVLWGSVLTAWTAVAGYFGARWRAAPKVRAPGA